ncbi:MAG: DEAD/DEAH box helicase [Clostridia bacterium]|nr:DEAD/DEAH box helicase [Clostridia bacterium]
MSAFERYAPMLQDYIYAHGWTELRRVQEEAAKILFDTDDHLLICSSTASGKTEAAFFPIISDLIENPPDTVGVLYVAPLKSLINDQFDRLTELLDNCMIPVFHWHGDVSQSHKTKLLKDPKGILQITPESLESMLINRPNDLPRLFGDLRYIVIDEVHALMGSDRGRQILCQLTRLDRVTVCHPRRVGLSATIGDKEAAARWLGAGSEIPVRFTESDEERPTWRLGVEHFFIQNGKISDQTGGTLAVDSRTGEVEKPFDPAETKSETVPFDPGFEYAYRVTKNKACLLFSNSREETEQITAALRQLAESKNEPDRFLIHHGNLSAALREETEMRLKNVEDEKYTACATVTLELGVDIGRLERVIQMDAPNSVSAFLQRMGRSGRRGAPPEMMMILREEEPLPGAPLPQIMPWRLLQAIAVIQLYLEEKFIEGPQTKPMPMSLLFQETLSVLCASGELTPGQLAGRVLTLPPFTAIEKEDYKTLLRFMLENDYIERTEEGGLIVGLEGEKLTSSFKFYASFKDSEDFTVRWGSDEIGTISSSPPPGERFALAGHVWEVEETDVRRRLIYVHPVKGRMEISWPGDYGEIHTKILLRMRQVLTEDTDYPYLKPQARERLAAARAIARNTGLATRPVLHLGGFSYCFFPWLGTRPFRTLRRLLARYAAPLGISNVEYEGCYQISFKMQGTGEDELVRKLLKLIERDGGIDRYELVSPSETPCADKYDELLPPSLLRKAYAVDRLDPDAVYERLLEFAGNQENG